jgi:hypothetical protein
VELVAVLRGCRQPLFLDFPPGDFVGAGNIGCADHILMIEMTAFPAIKRFLGDFWAWWIINR